jgi:hypothetical protein
VITRLLIAWLLFQPLFVIAWMSLPREREERDDPYRSGL